MTQAPRVAQDVQYTCVIRYDNEVGNGDHAHLAGKESKYRFVSPERLIADFQSQIERRNHENRDA